MSQPHPNPRRWSRRSRLALVALAAALPVLLALALPAMPQPQAYHDFADQRTLAGIPNFGDVVSNAAFLLVGSAGLAWLARHRRRAFLEPGEIWIWLVLFAATALIALGSAWYHLAPDNLRLYRDRLPMTLAFMAITAGVLADRVHPRVGLAALPVLLVLGVAGATLWLWSELQGQGDLRPYLLVQAVPLCAAPVLIALFPSRYTRGGDVLIAAGLYLLALLAELLDHALFAATGEVISGHSLKHLLAALAVFWLLRMLQRRAPALDPATPAREHRV